MTNAASKKKEQWVAVVGINHNKQRYEPGDKVPASLAKQKWLVDGGKIRKAGS